jgi:PhnB protein
MSSVTPYICVSDSRAAIDWYGAVFQATVNGKPYVMDDGRIGHVELKIGDAPLMMADPFPRGKCRAARPVERQRRVVTSRGGGL